MLSLLTVNTIIFTEKNRELLKLKKKLSLVPQVWSLDNCADEKSRATIEKMILEEEYLLLDSNDQEQSSPFNV